MNLPGTDMASPLLARAATSRTAPQATANVSKAREQAIDFESVFITTMLNSMFSGLSGEGPLGAGNGAGGDTWRSLLADEYGKTMARNGGLGLADSIMKDILTLQEKA